MSDNKQDKKTFASKLLVRGRLALKFTLASILGGALLFGISTYRKDTDEKKIKVQTVEAVFPGKKDVALRHEWTMKVREERNWIARHDETMKDTAKAAEFRAWLSQFDHLKDASHAEKLKAINKAVGLKVTYTPEEYMYGRREYYAPPYWTMKGGVGDCDDYAVLQYYALKYLGYTDKKCFVADIATEGVIPDHAVAVVDTSGAEERAFRAENIVILDNNGAMYEMKSSTYLPTAFYNRTGAYLVNYPGIMRSEGSLK
jgi:predicted transglutaminase-like cysteine proteinase